MARKKITSIKKQKNKPAKKVERFAWESWGNTFDANKPLAVPLVILAVFCIYVTISSWQGLLHLLLSSPSAILWAFPFPAVFVGMFSGLAAYMLLRGQSIGRGNAVIAWFFILISLWLFLAWFASNNPGDNPQTCRGLFGVMQNCADVALLQAYILFLNPFSLALYSIFAIAGAGVMGLRLRLKS